MNLHVPSPAEISARRARLMGPGRVVNIAKQKPTDAGSEPVNPSPSASPCHPLDYVKERCLELGVNFEEITSSQHLPPRLVPIRDQLMIEVKEHWPRIRVKRLADMFNRKESGIRDVLGKLKLTGDRPITDHAVATMRRMHAQGWSYSKIGQKLGVSHGTVGYHLSKRAKP